MASPLSAVVLCPPLGRDLVKSYSAYRLLAERLAENGTAALRFDYVGTGDSADCDDEGSAVPLWLESVREALKLVRRNGATEIALVGMGVGATIAAEAAAGDGRVNRLVLWDPMTGRKFIRRNAALTALRMSVPALRPDGSVETPGFTFTAATVKDLERMRIESGAGPLPDRVLILERPEGRKKQPKAGALTGRSSVDVLPCPEQRYLLDAEPPFQRQPFSDIESVAKWLLEGSEGMHGPASSSAGSSAAFGVVGLDRSGGEIRERAMKIGPAGLFAMATDPPEPQPGQPVAVFLNSADEHHIGPNRMWVALARRWAELGIAGLRVDVSGLGDSPTRSDHQRRFVCGAPEAFDDVVDVVRTAAEEGSQGVTLVGLCWSAYQAVDSALSIRPAAVVLINPKFRFPPPEVVAGGTMDRRRRIAMPRRLEPWEIGGALTDHVEPDGSGAVRRPPAYRRALGPLIERARPVRDSLHWKWLYACHPEGRPAAWIRLLVEGGTNVLLITGDEEDPIVRRGLSPRQLAQLESTGRFKYHYFPGLDHGLIEESRRGDVADLITREADFVFPNQAVVSRCAATAGRS
jgi:alpha-beta hydrolase superfamily lysophospholipase